MHSNPQQDKVSQQHAGGDQMATDPVCGMQVNKATAQFTATYEGQNQPWQTFYFCSDACKQQFEREPERYAKLPF